jgi:predicted acetyltransferase
MNLAVSQAEKEERVLLERLLELYAHDLSDIADLPIGADGRFGYGPLPSYWTDPGRHPYLVRVDGELAGFILVQQGSRLTGAPEVWDVAEFFVLKRHRRRGVGQRAAHDVWRRHAGPWEVRVMERNTAALGFWRRAVEAFVGSPREPESARAGVKAWHVLRFTSESLPD